MLKIYDPIYSVSVDGGPLGVVQGRFDNDWFVSDCVPMGTQYLLYNVSFEDAYQYLQTHYISGARPSKSIFLSAPQISLSYQCSADWVDIKKCKTFSLRAENRLRKNVTLDWIMKNLEADMAIRYLTERGMGICPTKKTK